MPAALLLFALLLGGKAQALAQALDWSQAGGGLFPGAGRVEEPADPVVQMSSGGPPRVPEPVQPYAQAISDAAARHGLDPKLLHALVLVESAYDASAVSPAGAAGLAQLMPATGAELGVVDRLDARQSLEGGAAYLARQVIRFGDVRLALAAYNAGPGRVARLGRIPDIRETQAYVASVVDCYLALTAGRSLRSAKACKLSSPQAPP